MTDERGASAIKRQIKMTTTTNEYHAQAAAFLAKHGIKFRATLSDSKAANREPSGHHYRVTLSRAGRGRITFDFWGSLADMNAGNQEIAAYDVLACISGDVQTPETFEDFCVDYGYDKDSIKARQMFTRCDRFGRRLRAFFTADEIDGLSAIQ